VCIRRETRRRRPATPEVNRRSSSGIDGYPGILEHTLRPDGRVALSLRYHRAGPLSFRLGQPRHVGQLPRRLPRAGGRHRGSRAGAAYSKKRRAKNAREASHGGAPGARDTGSGCSSALAGPAGVRCRAASINRREPKLVPQTRGAVRRVNRAWFSDAGSPERGEQLRGQVVLAVPGVAQPRAGEPEGPRSCGGVYPLLQHLQASVDHRAAIMSMAVSRSRSSQSMPCGPPVPHPRPAAAAH